MLQVGIAVGGLAACHVESSLNPQDISDIPRFPGCDLNVDFLITAAARDGIQALDDPQWVMAEEEVPSYLDPDSRVIGIQVFGQPWAIPHNVLWYHEIVNHDPGGPAGPSLAVTYCPLTGSSLVFDRTSIGGTTLGVSGILFTNNLVMFDRSGDDESLWPQMLAEARCGTQSGATLERFPFVEMEWEDWLALHPSTWVLTEDQGFDPRNVDYTAFGYPYGDYEDTQRFFNTVAMPPLDERRFSKERVLGVPSTDSDPGIAFPFGALDERDGSFQVVQFDYEGAGAVVLWSDEAQGGMAFRPSTTDGDAVTLRATANGFEDDETGSGWTLEGRAVSGDMEGVRLLTIDPTHTAFWGAWAAFHPTTRLWE